MLLHSTFCLLLATFRESLANILYLNLVPVSTFQGVGYECSLADRRRCSTGNHAPEKHDVQTLWPHVHFESVHVCCESLSRYTHVFSHSRSAHLSSMMCCNAYRTPSGIQIKRMEIILLRSQRVCEIARWVVEHLKLRVHPKIAWSDMFAGAQTVSSSQWHWMTWAEERTYKYVQTNASYEHSLICPLLTDDHNHLQEIAEHVSNSWLRPVPRSWVFICHF